MKWRFVCMQKGNQDRKALENMFFGPNLGYVLELYEKYVEDPSFC